LKYSFQRIAQHKIYIYFLPKTSNVAIALKNKFQALIKSKFVKNVAIVSVGAAGAQLINIAFAPLITRLYGPESFGVLGTFMAILNVLIPVAALSYPIAIVLPKDDRDAKGIAKLSAYIALSIAGFISVILLLYGDWILNLFRIHDNSKFILLIPFAMLFAAFVEIGRQWLIRKNQFGITARVDILKALTVNSSIAGFGIFYPFATVMIVLTTIGHALQTAMLGVGIKKLSNYQHRNINESTNKIKLFDLAKRYYDFPFYRAPQIFINALSLSLPVLMLTVFFGPHSAGYYILGNRLLGLPSMLIGKSVGEVFYPHITKAFHNDDNITHVIIKATISLAAVGLLPFIIVMAFGPWLFSFIFGTEWVMAGEYARWLSLMLFFKFINKPAVASIPVLGLQRGFMIYELFSTGSKLAVLYTGFVLFEVDTLAIAFFSIFGAIAYAILIVWVILSSIGRTQREVLKII
jgi:O-antigen/teichoic acid export membrane protein